MASSSGSDPRARRRLSPRGWGLALTVALTALALADRAPQRWLRHQAFDGIGRLLPRERISMPGVVVGIDEASLATYGQWPWPRTRLAALVGRVAAAGPAAIGIDIVMPEADRTSPTRIAESLRAQDADLADRLARWPDHDVLLGQALAGRKVVLGLAGVHEPLAAPAPLPRAAPLRLRGDAAGLAALRTYASALGSREAIGRGAAGHGLVNQVADGSVVRRMLALGRIGDTVYPAFVLELLRVATGAPALEVETGADGARSLRVAELALPLERDGRQWLRYAHYDPDRYRSAVAVLEGPLDADALQGRVVLVALTGLGLADQVVTPLGERVPGSELHLQWLENLFDRTWLTRPAWGPPLEAGLLLLAGTMLASIASRVRPARAFAALLAVLLLLAAGQAAAWMAGLLLDAASAAAGGALVFATTLGSTLADSQRQRRELRETLQREREVAARVAGELDAARRVQLGMLPDPAVVLAGETRVAGAASMEPARVVGGDFYDLFCLDDRRLCVLVGDVSGKGLPAAMFMSLIKARCQSAILRHPDSLAAALTDVEADLARENPELMFVTLFVAVIDLDSGAGQFCNAGHEPALLLTDGEVRRLGAGTPPVGVLGGFGFVVEPLVLPAGGRLAIVTDGVTEACNERRELYGRDRLLEVVERVTAPADTVSAIRADVARFAGAAEQADDIAVVVLRRT